LNFGNPEKEQNMGEFAECVEGIGEACKYLDYPVVSGNVSFYNETKNKGIKPTPSIGGVGLIKDYKKIISMGLTKNSNIILVIGKTEGHIDQSIFAREILNEKKGPPPEINLFNEKNNGETVLKLINEELIKSCHDISKGGMLVAIAKMCIAGNKGITIKKPKNLVNYFEYFFGEDQGRYLIEIEKNNLKKIQLLLEKNSIYFDEIGTINDKNMIIKDILNLRIDELIILNKNWLNKYMSN
jgi:phosphoribosylformylglycinamidine synthase